MTTLDVVPDEEVERLAKKHGPGSVAAEVWAELSAQRAKDRQVFAVDHWPSARYSCGGGFGRVG
jgi:hypothetical protein